MAVPPPGGRGRDQTPVSRKSRKVFGPEKPFLVNRYLKTERNTRLKLVWKRTSVYTKNIIAPAIRVRKHFGTFKKRASGGKKCQEEGEGTEPYPDKEARIQ